MGIQSMLMRKLRSILIKAAKFKIHLDVNVDINVQGNDVVMMYGTDAERRVTLVEGHGVG